MFNEVYMLQLLAMEAFATDEEITRWQTQQKAFLKNQPLKKDITRKTYDHSDHDHSNSYSEGSHANSHRDNDMHHDYDAQEYDYDAYTYSDNIDKSGFHYEEFARDSHQDQAGHTDEHNDKYTETSTEDLDSHSDTDFDYGFDHENYIPSKPVIKGILGSVLKDTADFVLTSYDANADGLGTQDERSKTVYYDLKIRRVQDISGKAVTEAWTELLTNTTTDRVKLDISAYPEGQYEVFAVARNVPISENGVKKTYESDALTGYFTKLNNTPADISVLNGSEFN